MRSRRPRAPQESKCRRNDISMAFRALLGMPEGIFFNIQSNRHFGRAAALKARSGSGRTAVTRDSANEPVQHQLSAGRKLAPLAIMKELFRNSIIDASRMSSLLILRCDAKDKTKAPRVYDAMEF